MTHGALPEHVHAGDDADALQAILRTDITLAIWQRPPPFAIAMAEGFANVALTSHVNDVHEALVEAFARGPDFLWLPGLATDAAELAGVHAAIMDVDTVDIRIDRIVGDACRKFHTDYVLARLLCTYAGRGTEWLDRADTTARPQSLQAGDVAIAKGRRLAGEDALVHRSPPIAQLGEERLLLVIDPARTAM